MKQLKNISKVLLAFFVFASCIGVKSPEKKSKKIKIKGTVTQTFSYCGGARPSNEMLAKLKEPAPFAKKTLYILKGSKNDLGAMNYYTVSSDSLGNFSLSLPPGEYCVVDEFKHNKNNYDEILKKYEKETVHHSAVDPECLKNWFLTPDLVFTVKKSGNVPITINYHHPCSWNSIPCVSYHGPMPP